MTIKYTTGNILRDMSEALVNPVNCVGVMGAGLALHFKRAFPDNFAAYKVACDDNLVRLGKVFVFSNDEGRTIINFPTKDHWQDKSLLQNIRYGLEDMVNEINDRGIKSVAVPEIGCGLGGLKWSLVQPLIDSYLSDIDANVTVFEPVNTSRNRL